MVGTNGRGIVDEYEHIFDIYTKLYDFKSSDVHIKSAQDILEYYQANNKGNDIKNIDVYTLVEYFVQKHPDAHFVLDEVPLLKPDKSKYKMYYCEHF